MAAASWTRAEFSVRRLDFFFAFISRSYLTAAHPQALFHEYLHVINHSEFDRAFPPPRSSPGFRGDDSPESKRRSLPPERAPTEQPDLRRHWKDRSTNCLGKA